MQDSRQRPAPSDGKPHLAAGTPREAAQQTYPRIPLTFRQRLLLIAIGLLPVLLLEGLLRFVGVAAPERLFLDVCPCDSGGTWVQTNKRYMRRFFSRSIEGKRVPPGSCIQTVFQVPKPPDTIRVAFLGESTTLGYPHNRSNASSAFLEAMLNDCVVNGKKVEVLNLGFIAVASYPVWLVASELDRAQPDVVAVYVGQNEFYGACGILSNQYAGKSAAFMAFYQAILNARLVKVLSKALELLRRAPKEATDKELIEIMGSRRLAAPSGKEVARAASNLETNLRKIARRCRTRGAPAVFCSLVTNEKDMPPLASAEPQNLSPQELAQWESESAAAEKVLGTDPKAALEHLLRAHSIYGSHALLNYRIGQAKEAMGDTTGALEAFTRARDLDIMPWRAPSAMNQAVRAARAGGVIFADVEKAFRQESNDGPVGWSLIVDHVHPSVRGQALMARTIVEALANDKEIGWIDREKMKSLPTLDGYIERLDKHDLLAFQVACKMTPLFLRAPFGDLHKAAADHHNRISLSLYDSFDMPKRKAADKWLAQSKLPNQERPILLLAAEQYLASDQTEEALRYSERALPTTDPFSADHLRALAVKLDCLNRFGKGRAGEMEATAHEITARARIALYVSDEKRWIHMLLANVHGSLKEMSQAADEILAAWDLSNIKTRSQLAGQMVEYLVAAGRKEEAVRHLQEALQANPGDPQLIKTLSSLGSSPLTKR